MSEKENIEQFKKLHEESFKVPEGYFEKFPQEMANILVRKHETKPVTHFYQIVKPHLALSIAMLSILLLIWFGLSWLDIGNSKPNLMDETYTQLSYLEVNDLEELHLMTAIEDTSYSEFAVKDDDIIQYLVGEGADISLIMLEL